MDTGTVKFFNSAKGYGFIAPDNGSTDVFVHISAVERAGMQTIAEGQKLSFEVVRDSRTGKNAAVSVRDYDNVVILPLGAENAFAPDAGAVTELVAEAVSAGDVMDSIPVVRRALEIAHRNVADYRIVAPQELLRVL